MVVWRTSPGLVVVKSADKCQRCVGVRLHFVCLRVAMVSSLDRPSNTLSGTEGAGSVATGAAGCSVLSQCLSLSTVLALMPFAHGRKVRHILCPPGQACQGPSTVRVVNWSAGQGSACVIVFRRGGNSARGAQCTSRKAQYATPFHHGAKPPMVPSRPNELCISGGQIGCVGQAFNLRSCPADVVQHVIVGSRATQLWKREMSVASSLV